MLGTHRKSFLYELIQEHQIFPDGYFYDVERVRPSTNTTLTSALASLCPRSTIALCAQDKLEFEGTGADAMSVVNVTDERAQLLLCSLFVMKSLVETVVLKPFKYKLIRGRRGRLDKRTDNNLNMLATLLTYVYRITFRDQFRRIMARSFALLSFPFSCAPSSPRELLSDRYCISISKLDGRLC